jgi:acyl carrier protein
MKLEEVFSRVMRVSPSKISDAASQGTLRGWDSFTHIQLFIALEEAYRVKFSTGEIATLKSVGEVRAALLQKGAAL